MSLVGPRPTNVYDLPPKKRPRIVVPPLPYDCPACEATLRSQVDYLLHNCDPVSTGFRARLGERKDRSLL